MLNGGANLSFPYSFVFGFEFIEPKKILFKTHSFSLLLWFLSIPPALFKTLCLLHLIPSLTTALSVAPNSSPIDSQTQQDVLIKKRQHKIKHVSQFLKFRFPTCFLVFICPSSLSSAQTNGFNLIHPKNHLLL